MRLVQLAGPDGRRVALVEEPRLRLLEGCRSVYDLASECLKEGVSLPRGHRTARGPTNSSTTTPFMRAQSDWRICPSADVPSEPARCLVSGTGLTHKASAKNRDAMHAAAQAVTDSTRMYQSGVEGGKPAPGRSGSRARVVLQGMRHGAAGAQRAADCSGIRGGRRRGAGSSGRVPDRCARARRGGSDSRWAMSFPITCWSARTICIWRPRNCAPAPSVRNSWWMAISIWCPERYRSNAASRILWSREIRTGESAMCHSLANIEHHHFKFEFHRRPGDLHIHFFGADAFSFGDGVAAGRRRRDAGALRRLWARAAKSTFPLTIEARRGGGSTYLMPASCKRNP